MTAAAIVVDYRGVRRVSRFGDCTLGSVRAYRTRYEGKCTLTTCIVVVAGYMSRLIYTYSEERNKKQSGNDRWDHYDNDYTN